LGGLERILPLFYGRPRPEVAATVVDCVSAHGFVAQWKEARTGRFTVGVLVAEREKT
jgi:hypothetical protein